MVSIAIKDRKKDDPERDINFVKSRLEKNDSWYTVNQFKQLEQKHTRWIIKNRWAVFLRFIKNWFSKYQPKHEKSSLNILDSGCGDGINIIGLQNISDQLNINPQLIGMDYNPVRIQRAHKKFKSPFFLQGNLLNTSIKKSSIDILLCSQVLEHIPKDKAVLQEINRILKPQGLLLLAVPNEGCLLAQLRNKILQPQIGENTDHINFYTEKKLQGKLEAENFRVECLERENFFTPYTTFQKLLASRWIGQKCLKILKTIFPSQTAGLIFMAVKIN